MTNKYQFYTILRKTPQVTFTVAPTPSDSTVKLNGIIQNSINVYAGDSVNLEVSKTGYATQKGKAIVKKTTTCPITLSDKCEVSVSVLKPENPTITISDGTNSVTTTGNTAILNANANSDITITITKTGYTTKTITKENICMSQVYAHITLEEE